MAHLDRGHPGMRGRYSRMGQVSSGRVQNVFGGQRGHVLLTPGFLGVVGRGVRR